MKSITFALSLILLIFSSQLAQAQHLTQLGERLSTCKNLESDDFLIEYEDTLKPEVKNQWSDNKLRTAIVNADNCFRVGTELKLQLQNDDMPFLGRGLLEELKIVSRNQLASDSLNGFSQNTTSSFIEANPARKYAVLRFKVTEKIEEAFVNEKYKRLPSCFPAYSDWESMPADEPLVDDIQKGKVRGLAWNGTFNCYKVGIFTELYIKRETNRPDPSLGYIVPSELYLVHLNNLQQKHADIVGENLSDLKKKLAEKKEVDGGWVTLMAFDYHALHPKDLPVEEQDMEESN